METDRHKKINQSITNTVKYTDTYIPTYTYIHNLTFIYT